MSSKVLPGDSAPVEPIVWRKLARGATRMASGAAPDPDGQAEQKIVALAARVAELEQDLERREHEAFAAGFRKAEAAGEQAASARLQPVLERFTRTLDELAAARRRMRREAEEDVVRLAVAIGRRILKRELTIDPEAVLGVVKAALDRLEHREVDRVRLHPDDAVLVKRLLEQTPGRAHVEVVADARLERGSAIFETPRGNLDASVDTQLAEIQRGLADRLYRGHEH
jgi:flagellar assembly protein FliH